MVYAWFVRLPTRSLLGALAVFAAVAWPTPQRDRHPGAGTTAILAVTALLLGPLTPGGLAASAGLVGLALYRGQRAQATPEEPAGAFIGGACQLVLLWWMNPPAGTSNALIALTFAFLIAALARMVERASADDASGRPTLSLAAAVLPVLGPLLAALTAVAVLRPGLLREAWVALASVLAGALALLAYPFIRLAEVGIASLKPRLSASPGWQLPTQAGLLPQNGDPGAGGRIVGIIILLVFGVPLALWLGAAVFAWVRSLIRDTAQQDGQGPTVQIIRERLRDPDAAAGAVRRRASPRYGRDPVGRIRRLYWLAAHQARRVGCPVTPGTTPALLQEMLAEVYPDHRRTLEALTSVYSQVRYGRDSDPAIDINELERAWASLVRSRPAPGRPVVRARQE